MYVCTQHRRDASIVSLYDKGAGVCEYVYVQNDIINLCLHTMTIKYSLVMRVRNKLYIYSNNVHTSGRKLGKCTLGKRYSDTICNITEKLSTCRWYLIEYVVRPVCVLVIFA